MTGAFDLLLGGANAGAPCVIDEDHLPLGLTQIELKSVADVIPFFDKVQARDANSGGGGGGPGGRLATWPSDCTGFPPTPY
jgi:hypothetical protein